MNQGEPQLEALRRAPVPRYMAKGYSRRGLVHKVKPRRPFAEINSGIAFAEWFVGRDRFDEITERREILARRHNRYQIADFQFLVLKNLCLSHDFLRIAGVYPNACKDLRSIARGKMASIRMSVPMNKKVTTPMTPTL